MSNLNEVKKNLFKIKKVVVTNRDWNGKITDTKEYTGVATPYFNSDSKSFNDKCVSLVTLDGEKKSFYVEDVEFKVTRITNEKIKKEADRLIDFCKSNHKLQVEEEKLYAEFYDKKRKLHKKNEKKQKELTNIFNKIEKAKGIITVEDFVKKISKDLSLDLKEGYKPSSYYRGEIYYGTKVGKYILSVGFIKEKISRVVLSCEYEVCRWASPDQYDFIDEEYDRTLHVNDLDNSEDFKKLKKKYFNDCKTNSFKYNVTESYSANIGDKDILSIERTLKMPIVLERKKDNYKDICSKIKYFLSLV